MSCSRVKSHKKDCSSDSSSSSSSSSSSLSEKKERRKHHNKKDCENKPHHHKHSPESDSEIECYSNEKEKCKHKKHRKHHKDSSDSECHRKRFNFCDVYQYFKNRLVDDESLMVAGSDAYLYATSTFAEQTPATHSMKFDNTVTAYNVDRYGTSSSFYPREDGTYLLFFVCSTDIATQVSLFINGLDQPLTTFGTNSGAGQIVMRQILKLKKDDNLSVRNWESINSVRSNLYAGGVQPGNPVTVLLAKIGPYSPAQVECKNEHKFMEHLCEKKRKLFDKVMKKLICDKELMVKGFNVHGSFGNTQIQNVMTNNDVVYNEIYSSTGVTWDPLNPSQIKVSEDGVYKLFAMFNTNTAAQFTITVNGVPVDSTTQGVNRGAGQVTTRAILELHKDDILTVRNYLSANGDVVISEKAGGKQSCKSALFNLFKLANLVKPVLKPVDCHISEHFECYYQLLVEFLLYKNKLQIAGSKSYLSTVSSSSQIVAIGDEFSWSTNAIQYNLKHTQGHKYAVVENTGLYDLFADIITDEPVQISLFVNGIPENSTIFGRDSGSSRCLMRQFVKLNKGDVLTIRNWESNVNPVNSSENAGGYQVGIACVWSLFMLDPECYM
jgi:translation initiation factor IF-1